LKKRLGYVLGSKTTVREDVETVDEDDNRGSAEQLVTAATSTSSIPVGTGTGSEDDDDTLSYFAQLAAE